MKDIFEEFKVKICPYCIHSDDADYQECNIVMQIDGQADCVNYKCKDYRRRKNETHIISQ